MSTVALGSDDLILRFEIEPGRSPDVDSVVAALAAWSNVLRAAASVVEPEAPLLIELSGVESGSQVFKFLLRKAEEHAQRVKTGGDQYPLISSVAIALGGMVTAGTIGAVATMALQPDARIPPDQMQVFEQMAKDLHESVELQKSNSEFYGVLQDEPAFSAIEVLDGASRLPLYSVPRSEFGARSGLWTGDDVEIPLAIVERRTAVWDVILIKPALIAEERRWTFAKDGIEFTALMTDKAILSAIHEKSLPIPFAEGVLMKIEVTYRERDDGNGVWVPVPGSREVKRVLSPRPRLAPGPLFTPGNPKKDD